MLFGRVKLMAVSKVCSLALGFTVSGRGAFQGEALGLLGLGSRISALDVLFKVRT